MDLGNPILWKGAQVFRLDYKDYKVLTGGSTDEPAVYGPYLMEKFLSSSISG